MASPSNEFREIFDLVDLDKSGSISKAELKQLMNTLGLKPNQVRMSHVWSTCPPRDALLRPPRPVFIALAQLINRRRRSMSW